MCTGLTFTHADAAPARLVGRVERLHHDALVPARQRDLEQLRARPAAPATPPARAPSSAAARSAPGSSSRSAPSRCRTSKNIGVSRTPGLAREPRAGDLERVRAPVLAQRDRLAVEHERAAPAAPAPPRPPPGCRAVTSSSVRVKIADRRSPSRCTWMRAPSSFHSTAAGPVFSSAAATSGAVEASIGAIGRPTSSRNCPRSPPASATSATAPRSPRSISARRTAVDRHARGLRHRVADDRRQRALPDVAEHERAQERLLGRGRAGHQRHQRGPPRGHRARAAQRRDVRQRGVHLGDGQRRLRRGRRRIVAQRRPADAQHALARRAREVGRARDPLLGASSRSARRDPLDLREPPGLGADVLGGGGELGEQHPHAGGRCGSRSARATARRGRAPVLVTGASSGIGRATALALAERGVHRLRRAHATPRRLRLGVDAGRSST